MRLGLPTGPGMDDELGRISCGREVLPGCAPLRLAECIPQQAAVSSEYICCLLRLLYHPSVAARERGLVGVGRCGVWGTLLCGGWMQERLGRGLLVTHCCGSRPDG